LHQLIRSDFAYCNSRIVFGQSLLELRLTLLRIGWESAVRFHRSMYSASRTTSRLAVNSPVVSGSAAMAPSPVVQPAFRSPRRVTITLPYATFQDLQDRADGEGRSLSNLAAYLLESSLHPAEGTRPAGESRRGADATARSAGFR